jgi:hypothetical protein
MLTGKSIESALVLGSVARILILMIFLSNRL